MIFSHIPLNIFNTILIPFLNLLLIIFSLHFYDLWQLKNVPLFACVRYSSVFCSHQSCSNASTPATWAVRSKFSWVGGRRMGTEGEKAPVLGCDVSSLRAFNYAVFRQSGQLESAGEHLPKEIVPSCHLLVYSSRLFSLFPLCLCMGNQKVILYIWDSMWV